MKNFTKTSLLIVLLAFAFGGCAPKTSKTIVNNTGGGTGTNPITDTDGDGIDDSETGSGSLEGCKGKERTGATKCYISALPSVTISGPGDVGPIYWSSSNSSNLGSVDPNEFYTDRVFQVRVKALQVTGGTSSVPNIRRCMSLTTQSFTKMKVDVMVSKGSSGGEVLSFEADVNSNSGFSPSQYFTIPGGTSSPLRMEIVKVHTDHRCVEYKRQYPSSSSCPYGPYADIPLVSKTAGGQSDALTYCVGVKLEFGTDSTYKLP